MKKENTSAAYIHIPFCKQKCKYCSFVSFTKQSAGYIDALLKEIGHFYKKEKLKTLYFGGGTPSLLGGEDFKKLIEPFNLAQNCEITVELNPESTTDKLLVSLKNTGVNRLSLGVQSFDDDILKTIGRVHSVQDAENALQKARNAGFKNINIDLIYGLPQQNLKNWEKTLDTALELNVEHISLYGLKIEEGSHFFKNPPKNIADSDLQADMYLLALEKLKNFKHYEISNFARNENYKSKHNSGYWNLTPYYGFGVSASGYLEGKRYTNTFSLEDYLLNPLQERHFEETNALEEEIFLGFRKIEGIDTGYINKKYKINFDKKYFGTIKKYPQHILKTEKGYKLSAEGILLSNVVLSDFL